MTIDYDWLVNTNDLADKAEKDNSIIENMTDEQLSFLVYFNWGYSGPSNCQETRKAIEVLVARGVDYNTLGEQVESVVSQYY